MSKLPPVGVIGVGAMGGGVAASLLRAGFPVFVRDIVPEREAALAARGAVACPTPAEVARRAGIVVLLVVNTEQIEAVTFGSDGLAEALPAGAVLVMSATVPPAYVEDLARRLAGRGVLVLDAPVSGGPARAAAGELSVMAAGPAEAFARCEAMLKAVAGRLFRVGDRPGAGSKVKIVNNLLAGINLAAGAEALAFGLKLGLDPRLLYDVVTASSGQSWIFADRMARALAGDYAPRAATRVLTKDLSIGLAAAAVAGCPLPLAAAAHRVYEAALAHGLGEEDDAALLKFAAAAAGVDPPA